jgi:hypothetical protein
VALGYGAIVLGHLIHFADSFAQEQLTDPPRNDDGGPVTLRDLHHGTIGEHTNSYYDVLLLLLHKMVHTRQYTEMETC